MKGRLAANRLQPAPLPSLLHTSFAPSRNRLETSPYCLPCLISSSVRLLEPRHLSLKSLPITSDLQTNTHEKSRSILSPPPGVPPFPGHMLTTTAAPRVCCRVPLPAG